jgi:hypothetical protein
LLNPLATQLFGLVAALSKDDISGRLLTGLFTLLRNLFRYVGNYRSSSRVFFLLALFFFWLVLSFAMFSSISHNFLFAPYRCIILFSKSQGSIRNCYAVLRVDFYPPPKK